jgi:16S rRNA (cytosine967-C5)-methyltransferase
VNAVLRRVSDNRDAILKDLPPAITSLPAWLQKRLRADLGPQQAEACAEALLTQASLDLSLKDVSFRKPLEEAGGASLPTGTVRFNAPYPAVSSLPGYDQGGWWVQDAAAALPARMMGDVRGKTVLDMCAAPGGKTLQLAAAGATVTALDILEARLDLVHQNLARTGLSATCIVADAMDFQPADRFDAILLDAPCSATGTIRRHPELPWLRQAGDIGQQVRLQRNLLRKAASLLNPGGVLVYAACSLLAEEGPKQVQAFLNENRNFQRGQLAPSDLQLTPEFVTKKGDLRTLPHFSLGSHAGMDGFYAARLVKVAD